jgi:hypothetical protein
MNKCSPFKIIDITERSEYERLLIGCIFHRKKEVPLEKLYERNSERVRYLKSVIPKGYKMKVLFWEENPVGMVEYGPPEASGLPILGENVIVMNCIWVHRKAKGNNFGKRLITDMIENEKHAAGFTTIALEDYWMNWMQKWMMEKLNLKSIDSVELRHKTHKKGRCFKLHLMWLPKVEQATPPTWDETKLLYGVDFCNSHPLYWGKYGCAKSEIRQIYEKC